MSNASLAFNGITFDVIDRKGQPWIQSRQLATALGYKDERSVHKIYERNREEFTASMIGVVKLTTPLGGEQEVRIFSLRGCHLVAMFARTIPAKGFRVWVLDVIDWFNTTREQQTALSLESSTITPDQQCTLHSMVRALVEKSGVPHVKVWSRFNNHFRIAKYSQLPQSRMSEAVDYLMRLEVNREVLPEPEPDQEQILGQYMDQLCRIQDALRSIKKGLEHNRGSFTVTPENMLFSAKLMLACVDYSIDPIWHLLSTAKDSFRYAKGGLSRH